MRVLVVEDDRALGAVVVRGLAEEGHAVDLVATALDARHAVATVPYDAVVLDLGLPDGDGTDVCRQMREQGNMTPVLMLTARDEIVDTVRGLDSGADDYLTKPFHFAELTARVRARRRTWHRERACRSRSRPASSRCSTSSPGAPARS
jgi:two-component system OmpR family response regulator